jgi:gamma-butyrobetaine dioxygenase
MTTDSIDAIAELFAGPALQSYLGEAVTLAEHMLQAAVLAETAGAPDSLVAAALLHDVGHVLAGTESGDHHADLGAEWLARWFGQEVAAPVRLHVQAKRYLCSIEPGYQENLSDASRASLLVQGGPMSAEEVRAFERHPHASAAVQVRRWDEAAKDPAASTPSIEHFRPVLLRLLAQPPSSRTER